MDSAKDFDYTLLFRSTILILGFTMIVLQLIMIHAITTYSIEPKALHQVNQSIRAVFVAQKRLTAKLLESEGKQYPAAERFEDWRDAQGTLLDLCPPT